MNWIKVEDRMPDCYIVVIAAFVGWNDIVFIRVLDYDPTHNEWSDHEGEIYTTVTHWAVIEKPKN